MAVTPQLPDPEYGRHIPPMEEEDVPLAGDALPIDEDTPVTEEADGSAVVQLPEEPEHESDFFENLADGVLPEPVLSAMATNMLEDIERDRESRKRRDEQYAEGVKRTGLGDEAQGGADFEGASRVVHPVLAEACIDFAARAMKELFPPKGPVKTHIVGEATKVKVDRAERKKTYMNWQLTKQIKEYRSELEQLLTQLPLGGSQYLKVWHDDRYERPTAEFIPVDDMLIPFAASSFRCAGRRTHVQRLTKAVFKSRVASGLYRDIGDAGPAANPDQTATAKATDKIEGKEDLTYDKDGLRMVYESYVELEVEDDKDSGKGPAPYILVIDESTQKVLALYRNWAEDDEKHEELDWIVDFNFVPWRGAMGLGLPHIAGGLAGASTGALRALLDSAHVNNMPGMVALEGARTAGQNIKVNPGEIAKLKGPTNIDDIRKILMAVPYGQPSAVLFQLMEYMVQSAKGVINTAEERIADAKSDMPVGTALALIEQGSITFSSIHSRLHDSQRRALAILHRIDGDHLDDEVTVEELGELVVRRKDFQGPMDIEPVSDPNIFSDAQRYAQNQAALQMAETFPPAFKVPQLLKRAMQLINYPNPEEVMNVPADPKMLGAVEENVAASKPETTLKAYEEQDHFAHLEAHIQFMVHPIFCANPIMAAPALPALIQHCKEHMLMLYAQHTNAAAEAYKAVAQASGQKSGDPVVEGAHAADAELAKMLAPLMQHFTQAVQLAQQFAPPPPTDPALAKTQAEINYKTQKDAQDRTLKQAELQQDANLKQMDTQSDDARHTQEMQVAADNAAQATAADERKQQLDMLMAQLEERSEQERQERQLAFESMTERQNQANEDKERELQLLLAEINSKAAAQTDQLQRLHEVSMALLEHKHEVKMMLEDHKNEQKIAKEEAKAAKAESAEKKYAEGGRVTADNAELIEMLANVLGELRKPRSYVVNRDPKTGDMSHIEVH